MDFDVKKYLSLSPFEVKNELIDVVKESVEEANKKGGKARALNAGRGNPNFLNTTVRESFSRLDIFVSELSKTYYSYPDLGRRPEKKGIADKFFEYANKHIEETGMRFLKDALEFAINQYKFDKDEFIFEICDATLGDFYPMPPRIFPHIEKIVTEYLAQVLCPDKKLPEGKFDIFATEGATAAMIYLFKSLKLNKILDPKDKIAIITPIFSPYLEIPEIAEYNFVEIFIEGKAELDWQIPEKEIDKLRDKKIKALYLVNPTNPTSVAINEKILNKIAQIVKEERQDLIILTDTVYATFVENFHSLLKEIPKNTICVYSYSKYFGVTGWRLGVIMLHEDNIIDELITKLPKRDQKHLHEYYSLVSPDPDHVKFIERLEIDSRDAALAHTGGLSCPQQALMALFSLFDVMDNEKKYKATIHSILKKRINNLYDNLKVKAPVEEGHTYYYTVIDLLILAKEKYGDDFAKYLEKNVLLLEFLFRLAKEKYTICLPAEGFAGPKTALRISIANLDDDDYIEIGKNISFVLEEYHNEWKLKS